MEIGRVKVDLHQREREFHVTRLSDVDVVKGLITLRAQLDIYNDFLQDTGKMESSNWKNINQEIVVLFADLDLLIKGAGLSKNQIALVRLLGSGLELGDVAEMLGLNINQVERSLNSICKQIVRQNNRNWLVWAHLNHIKSEWKMCTACGEHYPSTLKFYYKQDKSSDGLEYECIVCKTNARRQNYSDFRTKVTENTSLICVGLVEGNI